MSLNFRSTIDRWFGKNSGCSLLFIAWVLSFVPEAFSQEQDSNVPQQQDEPRQVESDELGVSQSEPLETGQAVDVESNVDSAANNPNVPIESREVDNSEFQRVVVAENFVNLMSGPGRGFPVFYVVEQNESVWVLQRKNNWFKVRIAKSREGWMHISDMQKMLNPDGSNVSFKELTETDFEQRSWEIGFRAGDFEGAKVLALSGGWQATPNLSAEFVLGQGLGDFSETQQATISVTNSPFPDWIVSPYFGVGFGVIRTLPSASLVQETDRQDEVIFATTGARAYITDRFLFRLDYRNYVVLTTQETNEEVEEWTVGFSVFF